MSIGTPPQETIRSVRLRSEFSRGVEAIPATHPLNFRATQSRSSWRGWGIALCVCAVVAVGVAVALSGRMSPAAPGPKLTHKIARGNLIVSVTEEGSLESSINKEIKCRVKGGSTVLWIIKPGTQVKPGDVLVKLDTATIEDNINAQRIRHHNALALLAQSESDVAVAKINIDEYLEGLYRADRQTLLKDIDLAQSNQISAQEWFEFTKRVYKKGYVNGAALDSSRISDQRAKLELDVLHTKLDTLDRYSKPKKLLELNGILSAKVAKRASDLAALDLEKDRLSRIEEQLKHCTIESDSSGMVILPTTEQWKNQPNVEEGAAVREDQVLLIIPDLDQMQVKLGVHEAYVDRLKPGMAARVQLQEDVVDGEILSVASVTRPAGWWNGNQVKYDTIIKLKPQAGLKPGMSASVEVLLARHENMLTVPVAAVVEQDGQFWSWVRSGEKTERRRLDLGDSNDQFIVVKSGLSEGESVVLNPREYLKDAQADAHKPVEHVRVGETSAAPSSPSNQR